MGLVKLEDYDKIREKVFKHLETEYDQVKENP